MPTSLNCIVLQEPLQMGQRVKSFTISIINKDSTTFEITKSTIGHKRIITFPGREAVTVRIYVTNAKGTPLISEVDVYLIDERLVEQN